jgi:hypothetical protein
VTPAAFAGYALGSGKAGVHKTDAEARYNSTWVDQWVVHYKAACVAGIHNTVVRVATNAAAWVHWLLV